MAKVKEFFQRMMSSVGYGSGAGVGPNQAKIAEPTPGNPHGGRRLATPTRKSCRERGWGMRRADGKWMTPWSLYLAKRQMDKAQNPDLARETPLSFAMVFGRQGMACVSRYLPRRRMAQRA